MPMTSMMLPTAARKSPVTTRPMAVGTTHDALAPAEALTLTAGEPSAFITTSAQRPDSSCHSTDWRPGPSAERTQIDSSPGGVADPLPST